MSPSGGEIRWLDEHEQAAWQGLRQMEHQLLAVLGRQLARDNGLSIQDYSVLVSLSEHDEGRVRANELGRVLGWEKSRLSHHISRMAARGLVERQQCPSDQRGSFVVLTAQGRRAIEEAAPGHVAAVRRYFVDVLSRAQLAELAAITATVLGALPCAGGLADAECAEATGCDGPEVCPDGTAP